MNRFVLVALFAGLLTAGCQTAGPGATLPVQVKQLRVNGVDLAYVEEGSGPTVVFVHGASGDWRTWDGLRAYVAPKYRFVSMSRRYHYPNAWADDGKNYSWDQHAEDVAAFIRALNAGKVHLVGSSYSGRLAGVVALKYPELLRSVVLGEPGLISPTSEEGKAALGAYMADIGKVSVAAKAGDDRQAAILLANAVADDPEGFTKMSPPRQQRWLDNARTMGPMFAGPPPTPVTCDQLKGIKVPALVVRGEKTRANFRHGHDTLLGCLPQTAEQAVIPSGTHFWAVDNPTAAATTLLAFIERH
jgi:pimeloyl-ACP methyl ester carboxylesterase